MIMNWEFGVKIVHDMRILVWDSSNHLWAFMIFLGDVIISQSKKMLPISTCY